MLRVVQLAKVQEQLGKVCWSDSHTCIADADHEVGVDHSFRDDSLELCSLGDLCELILVLRQDLVAVALSDYLLLLLPLFDPDHDCNETTVVRKLQSIGKKVEQDLREASLVTPDALEQVQVGNLVHGCDQLDFLLLGHEPRHFHRVVDCLQQVEVFVLESELVVLELR